MGMLKGMGLGIFFGTMTILTLGQDYLASAYFQMIQVPPIQQSAAKPVYSLPAVSEFDKLNLILERYRSKDIKIIVDGREYRPYLVWLKARSILIKNRNKIANAATWIKNNCYRSQKGNPFYIKYHDGRTLLMRDVFLSELALMNKP